MFRCDPILWLTSTITIVTGLFHSYDPILKPKPVSCGPDKCLYFFDSLHSKSATLSISSFGLTNVDQSASLVMWLIDSQFVGYFENTIYFFKSETVGTDKLTLDKQLVTTSESEYKTTILGNDIILISIEINSTSSLNDTVDLIRRFKIDVTAKSLIHLDSLTFPKNDLSRVSQFTIHHGTSHGSYSYFVGFRIISGSRQTFIVRLCNGYSIKSYSEVRFSSDGADIYIGIAVEPASVGLSRLLLVSTSNYQFKVNQILLSKFNDVREKCANGNGIGLSWIFTNSHAICKKIDLIDLCSDEISLSPSESIAVTEDWTSSKISLIITFVFIEFPVNRYVLFKALKDGRLERCILDQPVSAFHEWLCDFLGNTSSSSVASNYTPFLSVDRNQIESVSTGQLFEIMRCEFLSTCLACAIFGDIFNCEWKSLWNSWICSSFNRSDNSTLINRSSDDCLTLSKIEPSTIVTYDDRAEFSLILQSKTANIPQNLTGYEFIIFVKSEPCLKTESSKDSSIVNQIIITCTLGDREQGIWPVTYSIGAITSSHFVPNILSTNQTINITIDGVPVPKEATNFARSPLLIITQIIFSLIILFILSLRIKVKEVEKVEIKPVPQAKVKVLPMSKSNLTFKSRQLPSQKDNVLVKIN